MLISWLGRKRVKIKANAPELKKTMVILWSMVKKNIKNQYRRSVLGIFWTLLSPLLNMLVLAFVFSNIFGRGNIGMDYPVYVLSGNLVFNLMRMATSNSLTCIVDHYDLLTKTRIPYSVFPLSQNLSSVVNFGFSLVALIIVMLVRMTAGVRFYWTMLMGIIPWLPSVLLFSIGISFILSTIYVRFRDIKHIYSIFLTLWMYMTPIFYSYTILPERVQNVIILNPMYHYTMYFRNTLVGIVPNLKAHLICYGVGIAFFLLGALIFRLSKKKFILYM
jgi:ABC-2 type transport system permease protein